MNELPSLDDHDADEGRNSWLVTFSDLVLQLFAFVIVAVVLEAGSVPMASVESAVAARAPVPDLPDAPSLQIDWPVHTRAPEVAAAPPTPAATGGEAIPCVPASGPDEPESQGEKMRVIPEPMPEARLVSLGRYFEQLLQAGGLEDAAHVRVDDGELLVSLGETAGFAPASDDVPGAGLAFLEEVRAVARSMPDLAIAVTGHTDDRPIRTARFPSNLHLSLARAARVAQELGGQDPELRERVYASGYGAERPIDTNDTDEGRARNRRVEIRLVPRG